jgi:predicted nucleic acid-binding Zn ribbon protein
VFREQWFYKQRAFWRFKLRPEKRKTCVVCGIALRSHPGRGAPTKTCSDLCKHTWIKQKQRQPQPSHRPCIGCGKIIANPKHYCPECRREKRSKEYYKNKERNRPVERERNRIERAERRAASDALRLFERPHSQTATAIRSRIKRAGRTYEQREMDLIKARLRRKRNQPKPRIRDRELENAVRRERDAMKRTAVRVLKDMNLM